MISQAFSIHQAVVVNFEQTHFRLNVLTPEATGNLFADFLKVAFGERNNTRPRAAQRDAEKSGQARRRQCLP